MTSPPVPPQAVILNREQSFSAWYDEMTFGTRIRDVAYEAFCTGWAAAEPFIREQERKLVEQEYHEEIAYYRAVLEAPGV